MVVGSIISIIFTYYCDENKRKEISAYCEAKRPDLRSKTAAFRF